MRYILLFLVFGKGYRRKRLRNPEFIGLRGKKFGWGIQRMTGLGCQWLWIPQLPLRNPAITENVPV